MPKCNLTEQLKQAKFDIERLTRDLDHERNQKYQAAAEASRLKQHRERCFEEVTSEWNVIRKQGSLICDLKSSLRSSRKTNTIVGWGLGFISAGILLLMRRR